MIVNACHSPSFGVSENISLRDRLFSAAMHELAVHLLFFTCSAWRVHPLRCVPPTPTDNLMRLITPPPGIDMQCHRQLQCTKAGTETKEGDTFPKIRTDPSLFPDMHCKSTFENLYSNACIARGNSRNPGVDSGICEQEYRPKKHMNTVDIQNLQKRGAILSNHFGRKSG